MRLITTGAGYLYNDNRASGGHLEESDILSCSHCQGLIRKSQWQEEGGFCGRCHSPLCISCADSMQSGQCLPFVKKIEAILEDNYRRQQNARVLGI